MYASVHVVVYTHFSSTPFVKNTEAVSPDTGLGTSKAVGATPVIASPLTTGVSLPSPTKAPNALSSPSKAPSKKALVAVKFTGV